MGLEQRDLRVKAREQGRAVTERLRVPRSFPPMNSDGFLSLEVEKEKWTGGVESWLAKRGQGQVESRGQG
jgi:hypothetical protein